MVKTTECISPKLVAVNWPGAPSPGWEAVVCPGDAVPSVSDVEEDQCSPGLTEIEHVN